MTDQPTTRLRNKEIKETAAKIAARLGETEYVPRKQIERVIFVCGVEFVQQALHDALQIEAEGGLLTFDGTRRRTLGGVFFHLVRQRVDKKTKGNIFYYRPKSKKKPKQQPSEQREAAASTSHEPSPPAQTSPTAPPQRRQPSLPPVEQLHKLQQAEDEARERFEAIKELPPEEQAGLSAALRELKSIREEIKMLRQKHAELR